MILKLDGHGVFAYILGAFGVSHGVLALGDRITQPIRNRNARFFLFAVIGIGSLAQLDRLIGEIGLHRLIVQCAVGAILGGIAKIFLCSHHIHRLDVVLVHQCIHIHCQRTGQLFCIIRIHIDAHNVGHTGLQCSCHGDRRIRAVAHHIAGVGKAVQIIVANIHRHIQICKLLVLHFELIHTLCSRSKSKECSVLGFAECGGSTAVQLQHARVENVVLRCLGRDRHAGEHGHSQQDSQQGGK